MKKCQITSGGGLLTLYSYLHLSNVSMIVSHLMYFV